MKEMLPILLAYSLIVIIDICRVIGRLKKANLTSKTRKTLVIHLLGALIMPSVLTLLLVLMRSFDIKYLLLSSLVGVWLALFSAVTLLLDVDEKSEQTS